MALLGFVSGLRCRALQYLVYWACLACGFAGCVQGLVTRREYCRCVIFSIYRDMLVEIAEKNEDYKKLGTHSCCASSLYFCSCVTSLCFLRIRGEVRVRGHRGLLSCNMLGIVVSQILHFTAVGSLWPLQLRCLA